MQDIHYKYIDNTTSAVIKTELSYLPEKFGLIGAIHAASLGFPIMEGAIKGIASGALVEVLGTTGGRRNSYSYVGNSISYSNYCNRCS